MKRSVLLIKIGGGAILTMASLISWKMTGSAISVACLLLGLVEFLGGLIYVLTGKAHFGNYRNLLRVVLLGAIVGFLFFDLPAIYLFKVWNYQGPLLNPFSSPVRYAIETIGWGAFLMIFYDSYKILHFALDKNFHGFGLSHKKELPEKFFSWLGFLGLLLFLVSVVLAVTGFQSNAWIPSFGALGVWFVLQDIEFKKNGRNFLSSLFKGHLNPLISMILGSLVLGFMFEYTNLISPEQQWVYYGLPFQNIHIGGVPLFLLFSWIWMYLIFLSIYEILYKKDNLWK